MPHNRYYANFALEPQTTITLEGDEWHHLAHVSRARVKERVEIINGKGRLAIARLEEIHKKEGLLFIEKIQEESPAPPAVILSLAISRMNHLEWAVEKATELGASALWLFPGVLSEKPALSENQLTRLHSLVLAATKQCGRLYLPEIKLMPLLKQWEPLTASSAFVCDTSSDAPYLWDLPAEQSLTFPILFFVGPEKGFDPKELHFLKSELKAQGVRLHPHILRTETVPLVALSLIQRSLSSPKNR